MKIATIIEGFQELFYYYYNLLFQEGTSKYNLVGTLQGITQKVLEKSQKKLLEKSQEDFPAEKKTQWSTSGTSEGY